MSYPEIATLIGKLVTRLNCIGAVVPHNRASSEPLKTVLDHTIAGLSRATLELAARSPARHN